MKQGKLFVENFEEIGPFLRALRIRSGLTISKLVENYKTFRKNNSFDHSELDETIMFGGVLRNCVNLLESGERPTTRISWNTVAQLAYVYEQRPLLLSPLFSRTATAVPLVSSIHDFIKLPNNYVESVPGAFDGQGASYFVPKEKLAPLSDVSMGCLRLDPDGESDFHEHASGDELIVLLEGSHVELHLGNSGVRVPMRQFEFVHFRADLPHRAVNSGPDEAVLFVLRFNQLANPFSRNLVTEAIRESIHTADVHKLDQTTSLKAIVSALGSRIPTSTIKELKNGVVRTVLDEVGLSRRLQSLRGTTSFRELAEKSQQLGLRFNATRLNRIHRADFASIASISCEELLQLAKLYDIPPVLLAHFLFPTEPDVAAIYDKELVRISDNLVAAEGIEYWLPMRRLALSNVEIVMLKMAPGRSTVPNQHPGFELLIPLYDTQIEVEIDARRSGVIDASSRQFVYFWSDHVHRVTNIGTKEGRAIVIRFHNLVQSTPER